MTDPLPYTQPCGCPMGEGHRCVPPWADACAISTSIGAELHAGNYDEGDNKRAPNLREQIRGGDHADKERSHG